jgi:hypothetical protein
MSYHELTQDNRRTNNQAEPEATSLLGQLVRFTPNVITGQKNVQSYPIYQYALAMAPQYILPPNTTVQPSAGRSTRISDALAIVRSRITQMGSVPGTP